jgi:signal transduction histidine kinase
MVPGDTEQLMFVFENVIQNAVEASDLKKQIIIETKKSDNNFIEIRIIDFGIGIDDSHIEKIFDMFFSTKGKSRGLGLTLSRKIIENHGGFINIISKKDEGTNFSIYLPLSEVNSSD